MLNEHLPPQSVITGAMREAVSSAMCDPEFVGLLAEALVRQIKLEELKRLLQEGIDSGKGKSAEEVFDRLEAKYSAMCSGS